ncbi:TetR family transcriptional regulator [Amycolatopsis rubida]|uniref:TetR family transcriptional regulator n=1 Tax=Amycolatopsis rubida TaxID=112413 RepID=A0ABX0BHH1_9PSEU|nr:MULTISPECIES: TetR family transcriptional regulator [Amycolatopsis]MYW89564.1 TetR family transcriptional regulator [Amycolatopsis rubida]NEC54541.1 TetR family transcriptional regulator [Amycolatopsis rubida]
MTSPRPLVERKRRQARARIIEAAQELFHERGFDGVSVGDIAERAEVGRTTFFRHFVDKQEVVFAKEQELLEAIDATAQADGIPAARNATEAVEQLRPVLLAVCSQAAADPAGYTRHFQLVEQHPELRARDAVKMQQFADKLGDLLIDRGSDEAIARFAAQIAIACYQAVKRLGNDPRTLVEEIRAAFGRVLALGTGATEPQAE